MFDNAFECGSWQHAASRIESSYIRNKPKHNDFAFDSMPPVTYMACLAIFGLSMCFLVICVLHEAGIKMN